MILNYLLDARLCATTPEYWLLITFQALTNVQKLDALLNPSLSVSFRE